MANKASTHYTLTVSDLIDEVKSWQSSLQCGQHIVLDRSCTGRCRLRVCYVAAVKLCGIVGGWLQKPPFSSDQDVSSDHDVSSDQGVSSDQNVKRTMDHLFHGWARQVNGSEVTYVSSSADVFVHKDADHESMVDTITEILLIYQAIDEYTRERGYHLSITSHVLEVKDDKGLPTTDEVSQCQRQGQAQHTKLSSELKKNGKGMDTSAGSSK